MWLTTFVSNWGYQDLMGVCLVLSCLRGIRVNSLKVRVGCLLCLRP